jgi:hypothetical protein
MFGFKGMMSSSTLPESSTAGGLDAISMDEIAGKNTPRKYDCGIMQMQGINTVRFAGALNQRK